MMMRSIALLSVVAAAQAQCPGGKTGYTDASCAATQDAVMDAASVAIVNDVKTLKAAMKPANSCADIDTTDAAATPPVVNTATDCSGGTDATTCAAIADCEYVWDGVYDWASTKTFYDANVADDVAASGVTGLEGFVQSALGTDGTAGTGSFAAAGNELGRAEAVVKSTQNNMLSALTVIKANAAATAEAATAGTGAASWLEAKSLYFGDAATQSMSPSATADKRCGNFGTCVSGGDVSMTNKKIMDAFVAGEADATTYADNAAIISAQITITYMQATLRYVNKMDKDNNANTNAGASAKNQGEGWAFYKVVKPYVTAQNSAGAATIATMYNRVVVNVAQNNYCTAAEILYQILPSGTTGDDLGSLSDGEKSDALSYTTGACSGPSTVGLIQQAKAMKNAIDDCSDMAAAKAVYTAMIPSVMYGAGTVSLQTSIVALTGTADAALDAQIVAAFDGNGAFAAAAADAAACPARKEFIVKSVQNNLFSKMTVNYAALASADGNAMATWIFLGPTQSDIAPAATGPKRAKNYDTCTEGVGNQSPCTAPTNVAILAALGAAPAAGTAALVSAQITATYIQATLRYVNKMDRELAGGAATAGWKNQGEGWGFSLVIADALETANAATVDGLYNLATRNTNTNNYCLAFNALSADAAYVAANVGTLNDGGIENDVGTVDCVVVVEATVSGQCTGNTGGIGDVDCSATSPLAGATAGTNLATCCTAAAVVPAPAPPPTSAGAMTSPVAFVSALLALMASIR